MTKREAKRIARETLTRVESEIRYGLSKLETIAKRAAMESAPYTILVAIALDEGAEAEGVLGKDWKPWASGLVSSESTATVYRWRNAGTVARILRGAPLADEDGSPVLDSEGAMQYPDSLLVGVPHVTYTSLVPLYRILTAAKTAEAKEAAPGLIRETWSGILAECDEDETEDGTPFTVAPSPDTVLAAANVVAPTNRSGGGSSGADSTTETEDEDEGDEDEGTGSAGRADSSSLVVADAAAVEAASGPTESIVKQQAREYGIDETSVRGIMLAALRLASAHGVSTVQAVLARPSADSPAETEDGSK